MTSASEDHGSDSVPVRGTTHIIISIATGLLFLLVVKIALKRRRFVRDVSWIPGPPALPGLGNALLLTGGQDEFHRLLLKCREEYGRIFRLWIGTRIFVFMASADDIQPILSSMQHIDKSYEYSFLSDWLGHGLITSTGKLWHRRRKMLTPSFHSNILQDFGETIAQQIDILLDGLSSHADCVNSFDVVPHLKLCALDIICVTAMGKTVGAQQNRNSDYVNAVEEISAVAQRRFITPWIKPNLLFKLSSWGRRQSSALKIIKDFVGSVIAARKVEKKNQDAISVAGNENNNEAKYGKYKSKAFLDLLLDTAANGSTLSDQDIEDEVNTFMFAGHDTTSTAVSWCLYVLGKHPAVQEKIVKEYRREMQSTGNIYQQVKNLEYLDLCIKEVMRLYPVTPIIARNIGQPVQLSGGRVLAAGTTALIHSPTLHRDPKYFSQPHSFLPERFAIGGHQMHPFAYIPFSAGPRNCIGQRFAQMSTKILVARILNRYSVESVDAEENLRLAPDIVLKNIDGINIKLTTRLN